MTASTQIANTDTSAFIAVLILSYWAVWICLKTEKEIEVVKE